MSPHLKTMDLDLARLAVRQTITLFDGMRRNVEVLDDDERRRAAVIMDSWIAYGRGVVREGTDRLTGAPGQPMLGVDRELMTKLEDVELWLREWADREAPQAIIDTPGHPYHGAALLTAEVLSAHDLDYWATPVFSELSFTEIQKIVITLTKLARLSAEAIADFVGVDKATIATHLRRALEKYSGRNDRHLWAEFNVAVARADTDVDWSARLGELMREPRGQLTLQVDGRKIGITVEQAQAMDVIASGGFAEVVEQGDDGAGDGL